MEIASANGESSDFSVAPKTFPIEKSLIKSSITAAAWGERQFNFLLQSIKFFFQNE